MRNLKTQLKKNFLVISMISIQNVSVNAYNRRHEAAEGCVDVDGIETELLCYAHPNVVLVVTAER